MPAFTPEQVAEYKEAFGVIDKDGDGKIDHKELKACFEELGQRVKDDEVKAMVAECSGPLNFPNFLSLFSDKLNGTDPEEMLLNAFKLFDMSNCGSISKDELKEMLCANGRPSDRLTESEFNQSLEGAPIDSGKVDYAGFTGLIKNGKVE